MPKITFMGAGSTVFAKNVLGDSMMTPALEESTIALYDIDATRLDESATMLEAINRNNGSKARIEKYLGVENRREALKGANYVVNAIQVGGYDPCTITDFEIPKKYGLRQTIADTLGVGGVFRALRTIPVMLDFARDMEEVCPDAWFLNYTNPMAMLTGAMLRMTNVKTVGLCHSVQGTAQMLARWIGAKDEDMSHRTATQAVILALISRSGKKLEQRARFALITASIGAVILFSLCYGAVVYLLCTLSPSEALNRTLTAVFLAVFALIFCVAYFVFREFQIHYDLSTVLAGAADPAEPRMEQPFFPVRSLATSVDIYNGSTVVMGGMITEERYSEEDKIPILGDIPLIGKIGRAHV